MEVKSFWQNPRWFPFKIKKRVPSAPALEQDLSIITIFDPPLFLLDNTFKDGRIQRKGIANSLRHSNFRAFHVLSEYGNFHSA